MATTEPLKNYLYHVAIGLDQFCNALLGGAADELLFFWEGMNHCKTAYESELNRKQYPASFRK